MANNFQSLKANQSSEKFYLARLNPARYLNDLLTGPVGGLYSYAISLPVSKVKENATELTEVSGTPAMGEWSYNSTSGVLLVYPTSAASSSNAIVAFYYLFYTSSRARVVSQDPENSTTDKMDWEPAIKNSPQITTSVENILEGRLTVNISTLTLINTAHDFEAYLTNNDSFYKKDATLWLCIDNTDNIQKVFDGKIVDIGLSGDTVSVKFDDPFGFLKEPALMGDTANDAYWSLTENSSLDPSKDGQPIPFIFGSASRYQTKPSSVISIVTAMVPDAETMYEATNTDYCLDVSTANNRQWDLCRVCDCGVFEPTMTILAADHFADYTRMTGPSTAIDYFRVGDSVKVFAGGGNKHLTVYYVDHANGYLFTEKDAAIAANDTAQGSGVAISILNRDDGSSTPIHVFDDFIVNQTALTSGNILVSITLADNFEASHGLATLDPGIHSVRYRVSGCDIDAIEGDSAKHSNVLKKMLVEAGLSVNSTSFDAAYTSLPVNANFSIPYFDEASIHPYSTYVEKLLESTMGYIYFDNNFEINYGLFGVPSSNGTSITEIDVLDKTTSVEIEYQDIAAQIIGYNPHYGNYETTVDIPGSRGHDSPSATISSNKAKYLHESNKVVRFRHVLESISTSLTKILGVRSERSAKYIFSSKIAQIDANIGDDIVLTSDHILGSGSTAALTITSLNKSPKQTRVVTSDLLGIT